jgi:hypothetical protein
VVLWELNLKLALSTEKRLLPRLFLFVSRGLVLLYF